ncbi:MAG: cation acetate symporter [Desulfocapsa sp.]|uniref:Cation acetate symporter n=1 Tax=Desulfotalea psychrophila TaxID=84980 RepID=A0ABS3ATU5_9BACT|nr:cation acetate symporter [Desulfocapsa sp.]MBN4052932.1 cation acetate symporter [bacterium AH-315-K15]MBN4064063.1 cation acetate symporter [bacterium AH-315-I07]MBN4068525.1 cation acetate symporter [Desulfotalea psychrophila]
MDNPIALSIVALSVILTIYISYSSRRHTRTTASFYVAGGQIPWKINGLAMLGDYSSAASFLGVAGAIALGGIDGWWIALGFFGAWITVLLVAAGPLKRAGKFTIADALGARFEGRGIKILAMISTIVLCTLYLVPQIVGAGHLFKLLLGWNFLPTVIATGVLMALFVILGGMRGTTYNQAIQGVLLWGAMAALLIVSSIIYFGGNPLNIIDASHEMVPPSVAVSEASAIMKDIGTEDAAAVIAATRKAMPDAPSALTPGVGLRDIMNQMSLVLGLFFGVLGLPHILIRFYTVQDARSAQKSTELTIWGLGTFYAMVLLVGLAAMYLLYPTIIQLLDEGQRGMATNMTVPMLGQLLGGEIFLGIIAAGALAAMLSTSAGLLISATTSFAHDLYAGILRPDSSDREQLLFAKVGAGVLAVLAIAMAVWLKDVNVGMLVGMCFGIAASTFAPALLFTLWWRRLTRQGIMAGMTVGLVSSLLFTFGRFFGVDYIAGIPVLVNPALYSVPAAVIALVVVTFLTKDTGKVDDFMAVAHKKD